MYRYKYMYNAVYIYVDYEYTVYTIYIVYILYINSIYTAYI